MVNIICSPNGETFSETLVALLITVLALLMLPMSLVVSARINNTIATSEKIRTVEAHSGTNVETQVKETVEVTVLPESYMVKIDGEKLEGMKIYKDTAGFFFFDYEPTTEETPN